MKINHLLRSFDTYKATELHLKPNNEPFFLTSEGRKNYSNLVVSGSMINMMIFPLIPDERKRELPHRQTIEFDVTEEDGNFRFVISKSPSGFHVIVKKQGSASGLPKNPEKAITSLANVRVAPTTFKSADEVSPQPQLNNNFQLQNLASADAIESQKRYENIFQEFESKQVVKNTPTSIAPLSPQSPLNDANVGKSSLTPIFVVNEKAKTQIDQMFHKMFEINGSDLHLSVSMPPKIRRDGKMTTLDAESEPLTAEAMRELLLSVMPERNRKEFEERHDTDFVYEIAGLARFRANIFMDRKGMGAVFRVIPTKILTAKQLRLSPVILDLCNLTSGLVLVTGQTGAGKSTTLCAMIDYINNTREDHIITIEDPIEFVHENQKSLINQREVHTHTDSFKDALRAALREDPDVILIGEMRDLETISIAIETAETGRLVLSTLHTTTPAVAIDRLIDQFPPDRQQQIRVILSESLKAVIAQTLLPKRGGGRVAAFETLIVTPAISNLIREGKTHQIASTIQTGKQHGMTVLNESLLELVKNGVVEVRDAYQKSTDKIGFEAGLKRLNLSL